MKRLFFPILFCLLNNTGFAQNTATKVPFESLCPDIAYCSDCGDIKATFNGNILKYFENEINWRDLEVVNGVIILQVLVDSTGKPCAKNIYNHTINTHSEIWQIGLEKLVKGMPKWKPATLNGQPINAAVSIALYSRIEGHKPFDVNYLRNDKDKRWVSKSGKKIFATPGEIEKINE